MQGMTDAKLQKITNRQRARNGTTFVVSAKFPPPAIRPEKIHHAGISGGKDSTALAIWMVKDSGYPRESLEFSFCDTGNESPVTYRYLDYLEEYGVTTERQDFTTADWLREAQNEALDLAVYLEVLIQKEEERLPNSAKQAPKDSQTFD